MIPTRIGQQTLGGTFTGYNRIRNSVYAVIVSPKEYESLLEQKTQSTTTPYTQSETDGYSNTHAMNTYEHPAARYCINLTANGYSDWYLPSINELELAYRYLKPNRLWNTVTDEVEEHNFTGKANGDNQTAIPVGKPYTDSTPHRTIVIQFVTNRRESFKWLDYWSSTAEGEYEHAHSLLQCFRNGEQFRDFKDYFSYVRPVRRELVAELKLV